MWSRLTFPFGVFMRKPAKRLSLPPGGWLHVVHTFAFSKMRTDKRNLCENVCAACWGKKNKKNNNPDSQTVPRLEALYLWGGLLRRRVVNKLLGRDVGKELLRLRHCLLGTQNPKKGATGTYKSGAISLQQV